MGRFQLEFIYCDDGGKIGNKNNLILTDSCRKYLRNLRTRAGGKYIFSLNSNTPIIDL